METEESVHRRQQAIEEFNRHERRGDGRGWPAAWPAV